MLIITPYIRTLTRYEVCKWVDKHHVRGIESKDRQIDSEHEKRPARDRAVE